MTGEAAPLAPLTAQERQVYGRASTKMEYFHNNFRHSYQLMYGACESKSRPPNMSIRQFINVGFEFCHHLDLHHNIEEQHIFPILAQRMPAFRKELELLTQHKKIHAGIDKLEEYLEEVKASTRDLRLDELKVILDSFGPTMFAHLDDEVAQLAPDNLRKYYTLDEVRRLPM